MTDVPLEHERRIATSQRIADDITALREDLKAFMAAQSVTNTQFREHVMKAGALEKVHDDAYQQSREVDLDHAARIRAMEDWKIKMDTYGLVLKATFGVSLVGAVLALVSLVNMFVTFGR